MTDLFGGTIPDPQPEPDPYAGLGHDARRTQRQRDEIAHGIHPATKLPTLTNGRTCSDCTNLILKQDPRGRWWKCTTTLHNGTGPDMRKHWPACTAFQPRQEATTT